MNDIHNLSQKRTVKIIIDDHEIVTENLDCKDRKISCKKQVLSYMNESETVPPFNSSPFYKENMFFAPERGCK